MQLIPTQDVLDVTMKIGMAGSEAYVASQDANHVLPIGETTQIMYEAKDEAGNSAHCQIDVTLQGRSLQSDQMSLMKNANF